MEDKDKLALDILDVRTITIMEVLNRMFMAMTKAPIPMDVAVIKDKDGNIDWDSCCAVMEECIKEIDRGPSLEEKEDTDKVSAKKTGEQLFIFGGED